MPKKPAVKRNRKPTKPDARARRSSELIAGETIDRKLDPLPHWVQITALKLLVYGVFRPAELDLLERPAAIDKNVLDGLIDWIASVHNVLEILFAKTDSELEQEDALFRLRQWLGLLRDLRADGLKAYAVLRRGESTRRDSRRVIETKDDAARTYTLLVKLGASASEATTAINKTFENLSRIYDVARITYWTSDNLKKRASKVTPHHEEDRQRAIDTLSTDRSWKGRFGNGERREEEISAAAFILLAGSIRSLPVK